MEDKIKCPECLQETSQEAREQAIIKADEIYNKSNN